MPHQRWIWFHHSSQQVAYKLGMDNQWMEYKPVVPTTGPTRITRQMKVWYNLNTGRPSSPDTSLMLPATIYQDPLFDDHSAYATYSSNPIPTTPLPAAVSSVWDLDDFLNVLVDTPEFYQRIMGPLTNISDQTGMEVAHNLELETLVTCSDGSYFPESHTGSRGWVVATTDQKLLLQGAGPGDGHPKLISSYRSELGGLLAVLYTIYCICQHYHVQGGKMKHHCDNKGVLTNVFSPTAPGITPYLQADVNLVMKAKRLINAIPVTILAEWVKGHYNGKDHKFKHELNEIADSMATSFNSSPHPKFHPHRKPIAPPNYGAQILYEGSTITNRLHPLMAQSLHRQALISHIIKRNRWEERTFQMIHWDAHEMAFKHLTRSRQLSTATLKNELANTNVQNHKYYNKSQKCSCCSTMDQTSSHVLSRSSTLSTKHRNQALQEVRKDLQRIYTPLDVIKALCHGTNLWLHRQTDPDYVVWALTTGSLKGTDMLLTMAFN